MRMEIPVKGGTLIFIESNGAMSVEYKGVISREYAKELILATGDEFMPVVNGKPFREWAVAQL